MINNELSKANNSKTILNTNIEQKDIMTHNMHIYMAAVEKIDIISALESFHF